MKNKNKAFLTYNRLMSNVSTIIFESLGKLAALWYDEIILQADEYSYYYAKHHFSLREHWEQSTVEEMDNIFVPITKYSENPSNVFNLNIDNDELLKVANEIGIKYIKNRYDGNFDENKVILEAEGLKVGHVLSNGINAWENLNKSTPNALLPSHNESQVLNKYLNSLNTTRDLTNTVRFAIPNINNYSWDEIMDLRHHEFLNEFRQKMYDLTISYQKGDTKLSNELMEEILFKDLRQIAMQIKPKPVKKAAKGIMSHIPIHPFNPFSVISSVHDIEKNSEISRKYGWVYFMLDIKGE